MRRGPLRATLDDDLSTITIPPFATSIALTLERSFSFGSGCAAEQAILFETSLFEALPALITLTMVAVPMTMREINDLTDLQI
jgi:hypothetical protein